MFTNKKKYYNYLLLFCDPSHSKRISFLYFIGIFKMINIRNVGTLFFHTLTVNGT